MLLLRFTNPTLKGVSFDSRPNDHMWNLYNIVNCNDYLTIAQDMVNEQGGIFHLAHVVWNKICVKLWPFHQKIFF